MSQILSLLSMIGTYLLSNVLPVALILVGGTSSRSALTGIRMVNRSKVRVSRESDNFFIVHLPFFFNFVRLLVIPLGPAL